MTDTESFDDFVRDRGGLYRSGTLSSEVEKEIFPYYRWLGQRAELKGTEANCKFRPCFGLINNASFNAIAFRNSIGTACVGIHAGTIHALHGLFCNIMSRNDILIKIGSIHDETNPPLYSSENFEYLRVLTDLDVLQPQPVNEIRRIWADQATKQALWFVLRHELVHLAHGHVDYLNDIYGLNCVSELKWNGKGKQEVSECQLLEFDADSCSASWWCGVFLEEWFANEELNNPQSIPKSEIEAVIAPKLRIVFFQWAFSVSALFRLFGDARLAVDRLALDDYPPLRLRQVIVLRTVIDHIRARWNTHLANVVAPAIWDGLDVAEASVEKITGSNRQVEGLRDAMGEPGNTHILNILDCWKSGFRQKLIPYAIGGYLPS